MKRVGTIFSDEQALATTTDRYRRVARHRHVGHPILEEQIALLCCTEKRTREEIEKLAAALAGE